jgi:DNA-binding response OmpR family regulator
MTSRQVSILLVDDDESTRDLMTYLLDAADGAYRVTCAATSGAALAEISGGKYDLYILNYLIDERSGVDLCRQIRETDSTTPIVFNTGMARELDRATALAAGANAFLVKPTDFGILLATVTKLLGMS